MKRTYISPDIKIRKIVPSNMIATSPSEGDNSIVGGEISGSNGIAAKQCLIELDWDGMDDIDNVGE